MAIVFFVLFRYRDADVEFNAFSAKKQEQVLNNQSVKNTGTASIDLRLSRVWNILCLNG